MLLCPITRMQLLTILPQQAAVAEIGVAEGEFSQEIVKACNPRSLHLIDPWVSQTREDYLKDGNNVDKIEQDRRYRFVRDTFAGDRRVSVMRAFSYDAAPTFADRSLDWVYVDAVHSYDGALADLRDFAPKVTDDGLILGHDFANHPAALEMDFGVIPAVETFLAETGYTLLLLTDESYPTFVIAKNPDSPAASRLMQIILNQVPHVVRFDGPPTAFRQSVMGVGERARIVNGFAAVP